jgi:hypothetical protein
MKQQLKEAFLQVECIAVVIGWMILGEKLTHWGVCWTIGMLLAFTNLFIRELS